MIITWKIGVIILFAIAGCNGEEKNKPASITEQGIQKDKIQLRDLNEQVITLDKYKGRTVFLNFWATWCKPCIQEMPSIENAKNMLENKEVVFLMASGESTEEIDAFHNSHNYDFNYVRIENSEDIGVHILPTTFIFDAAGELAFSESGQRKWDEKNNIDMILKIVKKYE